MMKPGILFSVRACVRSVCVGGGVGERVVGMRGASCRLVIDRREVLRSAN